LGDVDPAVAERGAAGRDGVIVAVLVRAAAFVGMKLLAVKLDYQAILLMATVAIAPAAVGLDERELFPCRRKSVRLRHVQVVAVLEDGVGAARTGRDDFVEVAPPAELLSAVDLAPQPRLAGEVPAEGAGHVRDNVIEIGRRLDQVDDRLLGEGMRRNATREPPVHLENG
jgi:hypothetical protein